MPLPASADVLAERRARFVQRLDAYTPAQRAWRPAPDAWSPAEVAEHVYRTERGTLTGLRRALAAGDARPALGPLQPDKLAALEAFFADGTRRTTMPPAAAAFVAPQGLGWPETRTGWTETEARWAELDPPAVLDGVGLVPHPVVGPMDADATLRFLAAHTRHHLFQLDRIEASDGFPKATG